MYKHCITRTSRSAIVIAIDSSISMQEWTKFYNTRMRKMEVASLITNFVIDEIIMRSTRAGLIRDYYDIAIIRYSGDGIESILTNEDGGMIHINQLSDMMPQPVCYDITYGACCDAQTTIPLSLHEWITPKAYGTSPMYEALAHIRDMLTLWCDDHINRNSFPPMVINISAGCCSDAEDTELLDIASQIQKIGTNDGNTLMLNIYLADEYDDLDNILFPSTYNIFSDNHDCQMLSDMSSNLPSELEYIVTEIGGYKHSGGYKCFACNASIFELLMIADIGTEDCKHNEDIWGK